MRVKWIVWNLNKACPVGNAVRSLRKAIANAELLGDDFTVVPA